MRTEHAASLDLVLVLVEAEGTEQQVQVIHAPVADAPQALGDVRVTPGPVADGQVDRQQFAGEGERAGASFQLSGYAAQCAVDQAVGERAVDRAARDEQPQEQRCDQQLNDMFSVEIGGCFPAALGSADNFGCQLDAVRPERAGDAADLRC